MIHGHGQEDARPECSMLPRRPPTIRIALQRGLLGSENSDQAILLPRTGSLPSPITVKQSIEPTSATLPSQPHSQPQSARTEIAAVLLWPRLRTGSHPDTPLGNLRIQRSKVPEADPEVVLAG